MVLTLLHEGQQRIHRRKEQTFKPSVNILFVNCLNPKCGHSAACPLTCFLSFNILLFFKRVQSYGATESNKRLRIPSHGTLR